MQTTPTTDTHKADELLSQAILVVKSIEQALMKSNFLATAEGLNKMADLLSSVKRGDTIAPDDTREKWKTLRVAIQSARRPLELLDGSLSRVYKSTQKNLSQS